MRDEKVRAEMWASRDRPGGKRHASAALEGIDGVAFHAGADAKALEQLVVSAGIALPKAHRELLAESNGIEVFAGYFRLFGVGALAEIDSLEWNRADYWKFAWEGRCSPYWCFGETAWGDQYAYRIQDLRRGGECPVYFLDAIAMCAEIAYASFDEFLERDFVRSARAPYDALIPEARVKFGPIAVDQHLVYVPPLLFSGSESRDNVQTMNARVAMICNGDIATQFDAAPSAAAVERVVGYQDSEGRPRLRLVWR